MLNLGTQTFSWSAVTSSITIVAIAMGCALSVPHPGEQARSCPFDDAAFLRVDGAELYLEVRGTNCFAPVLLWLHGGLGGAERPLFRYYNSDLEDHHFVVAYLDQRGAGRSFDAGAGFLQLGPAWDRL